MNSYNTTIIDWANPPGATIVQLLKKRGVSLAELGAAIGVTVVDVKRLVAGQLTIDSLIAQELSSNLGGSVRFWLKREADYRESIELSESLRPKNWLKQFPLKEMKAWGWIPKSGNELDTILAFFEVDSPRTWYGKYREQLGEVAFRRVGIPLQIGLVSSWLRHAEKVSESIRCQHWNAEDFREILESCKALTFERNPKVFMPKVQAMCADAGVAVVFARAPANSGISGATRFVSHNKALLCLSFRHLSDDHLWFTFFHEAGHLLLHGKSETHIEADDEIRSEQREREANQFARDTLVPHEFRPRLTAARNSKYGIARLARDIGVSPGILVGQLQKHGLIPFNRMNSMKRRYEWVSLGT